jgi:hypothetical protein
MASDGSNQRKISSPPFEDLSPAWSPDGAHILYVRGLGPTSDIYVMTADGADVRRLTDHPERDADPAWSPDGRQIAFTSGRDERPVDPCSFSVSASLAAIEDVETLAWMSHQVVIGTVVEAVPPAWDAPTDPLHDPCLTIQSDYLVQVEQRLRGQPGETVRVRLSGGTIGPYTQSYDPQPELAVGDQVLLFLREAQPSTLLPPAYDIVGGPQGRWSVEPDGTVRTGWNQYPQQDGMPVEQVAEEIWKGLQGEPPQGAFAPVPLEEAPIVGSQP